MVAFVGNGATAPRRDERATNRKRDAIESSRDNSRLDGDEKKPSSLENVTRFMLEVTILHLYHLIELTVKSCAAAVGAPRRGGG